LVPVPLAPYTTFQQFRDHLLWLGCRYGRLTKITASRPQVYFERDNPNSSLPWDAVIDELKDSDPVEASTIQSVCSQLRIDPTEFVFQTP
jgi:hypothetical protein